MIELLPQSRRLSEKSEQSSQWATGICYAKPYVHAVAVEQTAAGDLHVHEQSASSILFDERNAKQTAEVAKQLARLARKRQHQNFIFRVGPAKGLYQMHVLAYKVEALLELQFGAALTTATSISVSTWSRKQDISWPEINPPIGVANRATWEAGYKKAIETAGYALDASSTYSAKRAAR